MKQSANSIANAIRLKRTQYKSKVFVLVEGDTDKRLFKKFFDAENTHIEICFGNENLLEVLEIMKDDKLLIAIKDADFDRIRNIEYAFSNLFLTDSHDIETMMFSSSALDALISENVKDEKWERFQEKEKDILQFILEAGKPLGYLRLLSLEQNLSLKFENLSFKEFTNLDSLQVDLNKLINAVKNKSQRQDIDANKILTDLESLQQNNYKLLEICTGHDLATLLGLSFSKLIGSNSGANEISYEKIESNLRLAYNLQEFQTSQLYADISAWANGNNFSLFIIK